MTKNVILIAAITIGACAPNHVNIAPVSRNHDLTVDEILANHIEATGGEQNYSALDNIVIDTEVKEPEFTVTGPYHARTDGRVRVDIFMDGKRVFSEGIDERGGWQQAGESAAIKSIGEKGYNALYRGLTQNLYGFFDADKRGQRINLIGRQPVGGVNYFVLKSVDKDGFEQNYFVNPDNWLIERRRETSALHPDIDPTETASEKIFSDFREVCGLKKAMATRTVDLRSGEVIQTTRAIKYLCNVPEDVLRLSRDAAPDKN